jgi:hypothetical protein
MHPSLQKENPSKKLIARSGIDEYIIDSKSPKLLNKPKRIRARIKNAEEYLVGQVLPEIVYKCCITPDEFRSYDAHIKRTVKANFFRG